MLDRYDVPMTDATPFEARLARLEAINDILRLSADYCRGADRRDLELFLSVWAPEGTWRVRPDSRWVIKTRNAETLSQRMIAQG